MVDKKVFRADLYQRLAGNVLRIPPLRDRPQDIVEIGHFFVRSYLDKSKEETPDNIAAWLDSNEAQNYAWPGNVRELQNVLRNLMLGLSPGLAKGQATQFTPGNSLPALIRDATGSLQDVSDWYMERVLAGAGGNYTQAARILGLDRSTVRRRVKALSGS